MTPGRAYANRGGLKLLISGLHNQRRCRLPNTGFLAENSFGPGGGVGRPDRHAIRPAPADAAADLRPPGAGELRRRERTAAAAGGSSGDVPEGGRTGLKLPGPGWLKDTIGRSAAVFLYARSGREVARGWVPAFAGMTGWVDYVLLMFMDRANRFIAVYIMASARNGTLYLGVTSNLPMRVARHKAGAYEGFAKTYGCKRLVWFQPYEFIQNAIRRETQMKRWNRSWKLRVIEEMNPQWRDLSEDWWIDLSPCHSREGGNPADTAASAMPSDRSNGGAAGFPPSRE